MTEEQKTLTSAEKKRETESIGPKPQESKPDPKSDRKTDEDNVELSSPLKAELTWLPF